MKEQSERLISIIGGASTIIVGLRKRGAARYISLLSGAAAIAYGAIGLSGLQNVIHLGSSEDETVSRVITVGRSKEELYSKWNDPNFMASVFGDALQIRYEGADRICQRLALPGRRTLQWTSRVVERQPNSKIVWRTDRDAAVPHEMFVEFRDAEPSEWGTEVTLGLTPIAGRPISKLLVGTSDLAVRTILNKVLRRFKALTETGEAPTLSHNPAGRPRMVAAA